MMLYDVWAVNGYDDTDMFRIGEHLTLKETKKLVKDPDKFDAMYQPKVYVEKTMNEVELKYLMSDAKYDVVKVIKAQDGVYNIYENVEREGLSREEAEALAKELQEKHQNDIWNIKYEARPHEEE